MLAIGFGAGRSSHGRPGVAPGLVVFGIAALLVSFGLFAAWTFWAPLAVGDIMHRGVTDSPVLTVVDWQTKWKAVYLAIGLAAAIGMAVGAHDVPVKAVYEAARRAVL